MRRQHFRGADGWNDGNSLRRPASGFLPIPACESGRTPAPACRADDSPCLAPARRSRLKWDRGPVRAEKSHGGDGGELHAGPIRLKFRDGELRHLCVGDKEVVRRIYFAVRDDHWATAMPKFTETKVEDGGDHFAIHLAAECKRGAVDYRWTGEVTGSADGKSPSTPRGAGGGFRVQPHRPLPAVRLDVAGGQAFETFDSARDHGGGDEGGISPSRLAGPRGQDVSLAQVQVAEGYEVSSA